MSPSPAPSAPLVLTMGDPAGVGGETALMAWAARTAGQGLPPFVMIGDVDWLAALSRRLGLGPVRAVDSLEEGPGVFDQALPVLVEPLAVPAQAGKGDPANGRAVIAAIERAVALVAAGRAAGVVTLPINKHVLKQAGFGHPGHTEFLGALAARHWPDLPAHPVMMLACPDLKVVPVTVHLALREAIDTLDEATIVACATIVAQALTRDFAIAAPRLALAGLNPHAGESGAMGREDITIIAPAVARLRAGGIDARGPLPADTLFHAEARAGYDVALGMYHDQVLIPIKTLDFHGGVNVTLGLPFVRTSPDHGTAFDIAGRGLARPDSLIAALRLAAGMASRRSAS
ncbi:4-hydroxythreonine-4-phosphate dehydrogenase PdxA [Rhodospirillum rubrum]|uniref:4-hydroxythreonine-4-phosphate dehydrogenase n=1 Tax=Rhodospirillum rubrum (strain ATCC 11170 / ATH 1.1.1 / DSM 467 / LMG 4362 / NCIMB 8255 / S1) TaxID=269796 RepID=Q2RXA8_RHORT|nr:4-hydroxythreonine-4-phosphate dehydrogenase PdxA [Rhodospirillum rubrum]ABC21237.1 4-hydroxythreonine-4-phosphate dehydrogenase [Rhodospirillum rubrum ATCC 11170]AEO46912.1 4-hydroxythreonine-4-phosphate dehydrogenase [Rhodospirillum rubrum F11]MBK5952789.1 4-hydroxythreonine-4-phosphate dehydrogenase [Rhodospirillum rubrum]QXG80924.1 4-hydroxythreonine-4-phosphate dehydrogenase PdxA [Rhodospirillum rubrum]HCF18126.1 4-hydroxythreonine-4-phosphate dehydrogenase PdxA [Rhodospirillum rubrum]